VSDVSRLEDLDRLYAVVKEKHGHIDILFANAGAGTIAPLAVATEAHFDQTFDVNVKGLFFTVQKALPLFKDGGSIILTSSVSNVLGLPAFSTYAASKAAVRNFARGPRRGTRPGWRSAGHLRPSGRANGVSAVDSPPSHAIRSSNAQPF